MTSLILHNYDFSNFAEKARLMLGFKGLTWRSVEIPPINPKPKLTPLTGGYRRTPVLQEGADVWCDTRLIARELERRVPEPSFFPAKTSGTADAIAWWAEHQFMRPTALSINVLVAVIAAVFMGECLTAQGWLGVVLMAGGAVLVGLKP